MAGRRYTITMPADIADRARRAVAAGQATSISAYFVALAQAAPDWADAQDVLTTVLADVGGLPDGAVDRARAALGVGRPARSRSSGGTHAGASRRHTITMPDEIADKARRAVAARLSRSVAAYFIDLARTEPDWPSAREYVDALIATMGDVPEDTARRARAALGDRTL